MFEQTVWEIILTLVFIVDKFLLKILRSVVCLLIKYYLLVWYRLYDFIASTNKPFFQ